MDQLLRPLQRRPPRRRQHAAAQPVALGHGRRVRLPVPELLPVPRQAQDQDGGRAQPAQAVRKGCFMLPNYYYVSFLACSASCLPPNKVPRSVSE